MTSAVTFYRTQISSLADPERFNKIGQNKTGNSKDSNTVAFPLAGMEEGGGGRGAGGGGTSLSLFLGQLPTLLQDCPLHLP